MRHQFYHKNHFGCEVTAIRREDDDTYDLQKELEAKFDELFGPIEDDDE